MRDILENYYKDFHKTEKKNFDKKYKPNNKISFHKQDYLKKYDILLTDSNIYSINNSKLLRTNPFSRSKQHYKSRIKQKFLPFPIFDNSNMHNNKNDKIPKRMTFQKILNESLTNYTNNDNSSKNKTNSTFYNTTSNSYIKVKKNNKKICSLKKNNNDQKFINNKSDMIVDYLLKCKKPSEDVLNSFKKSKDYSEEEILDYKKGMSLKMPTIKHKFLVDPLDDKFFSSIDLQIKGLGSEKYRKGLVSGVSYYYLKNKYKQIKDVYNVKKYQGVADKILKNIEENQKLRFQFKKNNREYKYKNKIDKNYPNRFIDSNMKNKTNYKKMYASFDQRTDMLLDTTKQLENLVNKRVNTHKRMKDEIDNI